MSLRQLVALELALLIAATVVFVALVPQRRMLVDVSLALCALGLIAWNAPYTRRRIWSCFPAESAARPAAALTLRVTAGVALAAFAVGGLLAFHSGGWPAVFERLFEPHLLLAIALYFPWALLQQTLFQFYLLGRLRVLLPPTGAILLTGIGYSLVHLPDPGVTAATMVLGVFWTWNYHRSRALVPLAASHAVLGVVFYYWVYGRDLAGAWLGWG